MPSTFEAFAACQPGLEPLLAREIENLGATPRSLAGGVAFAADVRLVMQSCLWLGTASHVMLRVVEFPCRALGELERKVRLLPWKEWLRPQFAVDVRATTRASRVFHTGAIEERVQNAISAAFGRPIREPKPDEQDVARLSVRFHHDVCTISLDAMSTPLHRRGYRFETAKAPLREDLAYALLLAGGFQSEDALLDPFCGSGTIAIEAAAMARGLAPGRLRPPALGHLAMFNPELWMEVKAETRQQGTLQPIAAGDRDAGAIEAAKGNAERAGVSDAIEFTLGAFTAHPWLAAPGAAPARGLIATNPPFGVRVPKGNNLAPLYQTLGHRAARLGEHWRAVILAHDVRLARRTGLPLHAKFTTRHGGLAVTALAGTMAPTTDTAAQSSIQQSTQPSTETAPKE
jgi:putative N6-adenine-specific DNA methylase